MKNVLQDVNLLDTSYCFTIYCDSQSAIAALKNESAQAPSKHIDMRVKFLQEKIVRREIDLLYIPSADNLADLLTKALPVDAHQRHCARIMHEVPEIVAAVSL